MKNDAGFTLMELIVAMAIVAILVTIGIPSFQTLISENRMTSGANAFVVSLNLARSEAIKRSRRVSLCSSADGATCSGGGYHQGWIVFVDPNNNCTPADLIQVNERLTNLTLIGAAPLATCISYTASGALAGFLGSTFTVCKPNYSASSRRVIISAGGRVRIQNDSPPLGC